MNVKMRVTNRVVRIAVFVLLGFFAGGWTSAFAANGARVTLTIRADGTASLRTEATQPRVQIEQQLRWQERMNKAEDDEDGDEAGLPPTPEKTPKPYTDDELAKKFRELAEERQEQMGQLGETKLESIDVMSNEVRAVTVQSFPALEDLLRQPYALWGQSGLAFEGVRLEKDAEGRLLTTLKPYSDARWLKMMKQQLKAQKIDSELRFVFPGKVLASGLPNTEGNATWIAIDSKQDATLDAAAKLLGSPTVITSELAGLKLEAPLDSKTLQMSFRRGPRSEPELPVTDAGPGFAAEPLSVTVTTVHWFPDGAKHLKSAQQAFGYEPTGAVVQAKLFAPKGRTLQLVSGVRVLKAVDDKGRPLATEKDSGGEEVSMEQYSFGGQADSASQQIQLRVPLPPADAQSIEQLDAEAVATTVGSWKSQTVPNLSATSTNEIDLASVLPGAKLRITKFTSKNQQTTIQAQIKGPPEIRQLDVKLQTGGKRNSNSWMNERSFKAKGAESTRNFTLQAHAFDDEGEPLAGALSLLVRFPEDQKRERVKFTLKGLDLL